MDIPIQQRSESPRVLIVLVNFRRAHDTFECLVSLTQQRYHNWDCVVFENGSGDHSYEYLQENSASLPNYSFSHELRNQACPYDYTESVVGTASRLLIINSDNNLGFAGGNNAAVNVVKQLYDSDYDYYWFLNNDTVVDQDALTHLIERGAVGVEKNIGIVGATLLYYHRPGIVQCYGGASYSKVTGAVQEIGNGERYNQYVDQEYIESQLNYISGASMLVTHSFLEKVGLMSEEYFLYYEEIDWATRALKAGFGIGFTPSAKIMHKEGAVLGSGKAEKRSVMSEFYGVRNRLRFTQRFYKGFLPSVWLFSFLQLVKRLSAGRWSNAQAIAQALLFKKHF